MSIMNQEWKWINELKNRENKIHTVETAAYTDSDHGFCKKKIKKEMVGLYCKFKALAKFKHLTNECECVY